VLFFDIFSQDFLKLEKRKIGNFSLLQFQKILQFPLGWGGEFFDELLKSSE